MADRRTTRRLAPVSTTRCTAAAATTHCTAAAATTICRAAARRSPTPRPTTTRARTTRLRPRPMRAASSPRSPRWRRRPGSAALDEGADTLGGIEVLQFSGAVLDLNDPVQLFSGTTLLGTFDDLKDRRLTQQTHGSTTISSSRSDRRVTLHARRRSGGDQQEHRHRRCAGDDRNDPCKPMSILAAITTSIAAALIVVNAWQDRQLLRSEDRRHRASDQRARSVTFGDGARGSRTCISRISSTVTYLRDRHHRCAATAMSM